MKVGPLDTLKSLEKSLKAEITSIKKFRSSAGLEPTFFSDLKKPWLTSVQSGSRSYKILSNNL